MSDPLTSKNDDTELSLVQGGPLYQLYLRTRLARPPLQLLHRRTLAFILITWVPLFLLSIIDGYAFHGARVPFLYDLGVHIRFLIAVPLLIAGELFVHDRISSRVRKFVDLGLVAPEDLPRFLKAAAFVVKLRNSIWVEILLIVVVLTLGHWIWREQIAAAHVHTWYAIADENLKLTHAGNWFVLVSMPLLRFLLLRWYFRIGLWYVFLWRVSRIQLRLNALNPDKAGGLGFLGKSAYAFIPVLFAHTTLLAAYIANRIFHGSATLPYFKLEIISLVVILVLVVLIPQTFFVPQLIRTKRSGKREYGTFALKYANDFKQKWLSGKTPSEEALGSADIQSLADLAGGFDIVHDMRLFPFGKSLVFNLAAIILIPLAPLLLTIIPLEEIVSRLLEAVI